MATYGSEDAQLAAKAAAEFGSSTGSELHVVLVFLWARPTASRARERLEKTVRRIERSGGAVQRSHLKGGEPDVEIVALGAEIGAGLIVVGSRGLDGMKWALTSIIREHYAESLGG